MAKTATIQSCDTCKLCTNGWCDIWNCAVDNSSGSYCQHHKEEDK